MKLNAMPEVLQFVKFCLEPLSLDDPILFLIGGRFEDEDAENYRISVAERAELKKEFLAQCSVVVVENLGELFVPIALLNFVDGKEMHLVGGDCINFVSAEDGS